MERLANLHQNSANALRAAEAFNSNLSRLIGEELIQLVDPSDSYLAPTAV
jgi:hypothetical protein